VKKVVHHLTRTTRLLLIVATIVIALLVTAARLLLPLVEEYRHDLEAKISEQVGKPVQVGELRAHLRGFYPELILKEVAILSADQKTVVTQFKELRVGLSLSELLTAASVRPLWVTLVGAELTVTRKEDGSLSIKGLGSEGKEGEFPHWLFTNGRFEILESRLFWQNLKIDGPAIELNNIKVSLLNDGARHQLDVQAELPKEKGRLLKINMDYQGNIAVANEWQGAVYVEGKTLNIAKLLEEEPLENVSVDNGQADLKIWGEWKGASVQFIQGEVSFTNLAVSSLATEDSAQKRLALSRLSGWFRLQFDQAGWNLAATNIHVARTVETGPRQDSLTVDYHDNLVRLAGSYLNIAELRAILLASGQLTVEQQEIVQGLSPSGRLVDFAVIAKVADNKVESSWFCGRFNHIKLEAWQKIPGIENVEGRFCGSDYQGYAELGGGDAQINIAQLFRTPWQISNSQGRIYWQKQLKGWRLFSDHFAVDTPDIKTATQFELLLEEGQAPLIELQSAFQEGVMANAALYYPVKIMPRDVTHWLDRALVSGRVISGGVLLRGRLNKFPFRESEGVFEVLFDADRATLDYQPDWPLLTGVQAEVRFYQDDVVIRADGGVIEGATVEQAEVSIFGLRQAQWLNITGEVVGDVSQSMRFLKNSPLHNRVDALLNVVEVSGDHKIELEIEVPLRKGIGQPKVDGTAMLNEAHLIVNGINLEVSKVNGQLAFDEEGIGAKALTATVLNEAVEIELTRGQRDLLLKAKGHAGMVALSQQFPTAIWPYLEGKTAYDLSLTIPTRGGKSLSTLLKIRSDTKGVALNLPAPYGKKAVEKRPFSLILPLKRGQKTEMKLAYAGSVKAALLFPPPGEKHFKLLKGEVRLDGEKPSLPAKGLRLAGSLGRFDVAPWVKFQSADTSASESKFGQEAILQELDLKMDELIWGQRTFGDVAFHLKRSKAGWEGQVSSQFGQGFMRLPDDLKGNTPLVLKLDRLVIPAPSLISEGEAASAEIVTPSQLPNLSLNAAQLIWKGRNFGALTLETERVKQGIRINQLQIDSVEDHLKSTGEWLSMEKGKSKTAFQGQLNSEALGGLVERLGITQALTSEEGEVNFSLNWQGAPWDMQVETLQGQFGMKLGKGQLLDIEPGAGRLLGLLSLQTIRRRLSLDFSDLFSKGFSFDSIVANYNVVSGDAWTDDFFLDGPVARIDLQGRMGLAKQDYDQTVVVTPRTTDNLPVAGALLGGPVVGAAVFIAQKLLGSHIEEATQSRYALTGSWDKPELVRLRGGQQGVVDTFNHYWKGQEPVVRDNLE
jgi:uncharacterized protein (TIGR02099 family)